MYNLTLLTLTKNEADKIDRMIKSVSPVVKEIVVIDTGSTDGTKDIIKKIRPDAKIFYEPFTNFSDLLNKGIKHCTSKWIIVVDADEQLLRKDYRFLKELLNQKRYDAFAIPRKHWKELEMKNWYKAVHWHPNYAQKLFKNNGKIKYKGYISPVFVGYNSLSKITNGLHIQHFNLVYNTPEILDQKQQLYLRLLKKQDIDINAGRKRRRKR